MSPDLINGTYEAIGAIVIFSSVVRLYRDKQVRGISWLMPLFFLTWGLWNPYYYASLDQWWSFTAGLFLAAANLLYVVLLLVYDDRNWLSKMFKRRWYK